MCRKLQNGVYYGFPYAVDTKTFNQHTKPFSMCNSLHSWLHALCVSNVQSQYDQSWFKLSDVVCQMSQPICVSAVLSI